MEKNFDFVSIIAVDDSPWTVKFFSARLLCDAIQMYILGENDVARPVGIGCVVFGKMVIVSMLVTSYPMEPRVARDGTVA